MNNTAGSAKGIYVQGLISKTVPFFSRALLCFKADYRCYVGISGDPRFRCTYRTWVARRLQAASCKLQAGLRRGC